MDQELLGMVMKVWAAWSSDPGSPMALGAALFVVVYLATRAPYTSALVGRYLDTDAKRRAFSVVVAVLPGLALVLSEQMAWNAAARTALLSWGVSQAIFFLSKAPKGDTGAAPPAVLLVAMFAAASQAACTPQQMEQARTGLEAARDIAAVAEPCVAAARDVEIARCESDECRRKVVDSYAPLADAFAAFHAAWCSLSPESEGCAE